jgi:hypothetical protein
MPITINTNTRVTAKAEAKRFLEQSCQSLPKMTEIPHWTALRDKKYADVWMGVGSDEWAKTHGGYPFGLNLTGREEYQKLRDREYTGNFFKLKNGTLVWIGNLDSAEYLKILDKNLLSDPDVFDIRRGDYWYLQSAREHFGKQNVPWGASFSHHMFQDVSTLHLGNTRNKQSLPNQHGISYKNWFDLLTQLENRKLPVGKAIVIGYSDKGIISATKASEEVGNFLKSPLGKIITTAGIVGAGALAGVNISPQQANSFIDNVISLTDTVSQGKMPTTQQIMVASAGLIPGDLASYINPAQKLLDAYGSQDPNKLALVAMDLGVTPSKVQSLLGYGRSKEGSIGAFYDGLKPGTNLTDKNNLLTTYKVGGYVLDASQKANSYPKVYAQIINKDGTINSPLVQNASTLSIGDSLTSITPNIDNIVRAMIESKVLQDDRERRNAIHQATGRQELDTKLPNMCLTSMILQAETCARNSEPYILPSEIPTEYRRCYSASITAETGIPVVDKSASPTPAKPTPSPKQTNKPKSKSKKKRLAFI